MARTGPPESLLLPSLLPVSEPVEAGDLLALDPLRPGQLKSARRSTRWSWGSRGRAAADDDGTLQAPVCDTGRATVKADASTGPSRRETCSSRRRSPGHAMRAPEGLAAGPSGKALEPLEAGTGLISVLVMSR